MKRNEADVMLVALKANDLLLAANGETATKWIKETVAEMFGMEDLREAKHWYRLQTSRMHLQPESWLTQRK